MPTRAITSAVRCRSRGSKRLRAGSRRVSASRNSRESKRPAPLDARFGPLRVVQMGAHEADVLAQHIESVREGERHAQMIDRLLDRVELRQELAPFVFGGAVHHAALD